jgi:hypothetical protein
MIIGSTQQCSALKKGMYHVARQYAILFPNQQMATAAGSDKEHTQGVSKREDKDKAVGRMGMLYAMQCHSMKATSPVTK